MLLISSEPYQNTNSHKGFQMSVKDALGKYRLGVFEKVYDEVSDADYEIQHGVGKRITMRATGAGAQGDGVFETSDAPITRHNKGAFSTLRDRMRYDAEYQNAVKTRPVLSIDDVFGPGGPTKEKPVRAYAGGQMVTRSREVEIFKKPARKL